MNLRERFYRIACLIFRREIIRDGFRGILAREPDEEALSAYAESFKELGAGGLIKELSGSPEAWEKQKGAHAEDLIRDAYLGVLGREADENGLKGYEGSFKEIGTRGVIRELSASAEAWERSYKIHAARFVTEMYKAILGRKPDSQGLKIYSNKISNPDGFRETLALIANSEEFKGKELINTTTINRKFDSDFSANDISAQKIVFLHLPKTGGTTMHHLLLQHFPEATICPERFNGLRHYRAGELARYRLFSGHFDLPSVRLIPGSKKVITMLRDPVSRLISLYYFQRAHTIEVIKKYDLHMARLANQFSMLEFFRVPEVRRMPGINNAMTRILTQGIEGRRSEPILDDTGEDLSLDLALGELASLDTFGIMERYEESTGIIFPILGFPIPETVPQKQKLELIANEEAGLRPIEKENVTEEIREAIQTLVSKDVLIYQKGTQIFNERIKQK